MPNPLVLTVGPFVGVNDTPSIAAQDAERANALLNFYGPAAVVGGDLISRPGVTRVPFQSTLTGTASRSNAAVTGSGTAFTTEVATGDIIEISGTKMLVTAVISNTVLTTSTWGTVSSGAITRYAGGIVGGPLIGVYNYANTDGTVKRYVLARGTNSLIAGGAASRYVFDDIAATSTALTGTLSSFPNASTTVTGSGTSFTTELQVGDLVTFAGDSPGAIAGGYRTGLTFRVVQISSNTQMAVHTANTGTGGSSATMTKQSGGLRLIEYDPSATPTLKDRTSSSMHMVALDRSTRVYGTTFANYFILSDGTNRPRKITSAFVLSNLTDANYAFLGPLTQYYGKLFGIDASDAITIRWSEENDPDTGYGTGTSDNSWALRQTSADPLTGLIGTNDALYCFRQNSAAIITGAANSDFRSSGTVDAIQNIGSKSPDSLLVINSSVCFLDQYGRPGRIQPGYGYIPLWKRIQETLRGIGLTAAQLRAAWGRYDPTTNLVKFAYRASSGATTNAQMVVFDADSWECLGTHKWYADTSYTVCDHAASAIWLDANAYPRHVVASGATSDVALYIQRTESTPSASAQDATSGGNATVQVSLTTPKLGVDPVMEKEFQRIVVGTRNVGGGTAGVTLWKSSYVGPYLTAYTSAAAMRLGGGTSVPATCTVDGAAYKVEQTGITVNGRWMQVTLTNDTTGTARSTVDQITVVAVPLDGDYTRR